MSDQTQHSENVKDELETENCEEEVDDEEAVDDEKVVDDEEIGHLKNKVSLLTYKNNRYHLMLSNCTMCSDDLDTDGLSTFLDASAPQTF